MEFLYSLMCFVQIWTYNVWRKNKKNFCRIDNWRVKVDWLKVRLASSLILLSDAKTGLSGLFWNYLFDPRELKKSHPTILIKSWLFLRSYTWYLVTLRLCDPKKADNTETRDTSLRQVSGARFSDGHLALTQHGEHREDASHFTLKNR